MLYLSLLPASVLLILAHAAARRPPAPVRWGLFLGVGLPVALFGCGLLVFPVAWVLLVTLGVALGVWAVRRHRTRRFWPLSATAFVTAYLIAFLLFTAPQLRESTRLRRGFPFESLADRLPEPQPPTHPLPDGAAGSLAEFDREVERAAQRGWVRDQHLRQLHERTTDEFVDAPGFGVGRVHIGPPSRATLGQEERPAPPDQPGPRGTSAGDTEPAEAGAVVAADDAARTMHAAGVVDFVNPDGFGLVRGRSRVAGFRPHGFSKVPDGKPKWEAETVELVGLLVHPEPVVYVSAKLPAMDQLRGTPTRPLDEFETAGLARLRAGEDHYAAGAGDRLRLVGSLRNGKTCEGCHGGGYRDLLGAFSYTLRTARP
ncbi:MAG: hypothetical protein K2X87_24045 [Gemmataceae bacterium]|nr:hypothetical protein [Gemmataceae bacterium]